MGNGIPRCLLAHGSDVGKFLLIVVHLLLVGFPYFLLDEAQQFETCSDHAFSCSGSGYVEDVEVGKYLKAVIDGKDLGECNAQGCERSE